ncbi:MAG: hypothetical protein IKS17_05805 [Firmicutes bacterium]|nr:hypothetical protein [Bacillota bacterium]
MKKIFVWLAILMVMPQFYPGNAADKTKEEARCYCMVTKNTKDVRVKFKMAEIWDEWFNADNRGR